MNKDMQHIDAIYITESGITFESKATWPHENFIILKWKHPDKEKETRVEFVYFGSYKNRAVYHDVRIEESSHYLY